MQLRSGKIIHMADEASNVNGGSSTNDSIPVTVQSSDVTSRSEGVVLSESIVVTSHVEENHHDLVNLLTQQMTTILNPMMVDHELKFERLARSICYLSLPESEVVKITVMGLGFYMRRKLLNVHIPDLAHLAERVCQVELMKKENEKYRNEQKLKSKPFTRKKKVAYVTMESSDEEFDLEAEERMKKELAHREEQARQRQPIRRIEGQSSKAPQQNVVAPLSPRGYPRGRERRNLNQNKKPQSDKSKGATPSVHSRIVFPSDGETCPKEILSPAKLEKGKAIAHSSGIDKGKEADLDEEYFEEGDDEMVRTISIIPTEYVGEYEGVPEEDYDKDSEEAFSFIRYEDEPGYFLRPTEKQKSHLFPLHITTTLSGIKVNNVLIDGGAVISLLPERMLIKVENKSGSSDEVESFRDASSFLSYNNSMSLIEFSHGLSFSSLCNASDIVSSTTDLIAEVHCVKNKAVVNPVKDHVRSVYSESVDFSFDYIYDLEPWGFKKQSAKDEDHFKGFESQDPLQEINLGNGFLNKLLLLLLGSG
ncbi:hypothetical protein Ahy_B01g056158 [Arachis hypogaea]|uniref:Uncharacterized protein n=1 Tax=Arachis hypogaea TaxID=3818 RepID=A0A445AY67_ARAHY|nr:hypothetical protein Ahy_B01g056158 [Arachis hypogaea]